MRGGRGARRLHSLRQLAHRAPEDARLARLLSLPRRAVPAHAQVHGRAARRLVHRVQPRQPRLARHDHARVSARARLLRGEHAAERAVCSARRARQAGREGEAGECGRGHGSRRRRQGFHQSVPREEAQYRRSHRF